MPQAPQRLRPRIAIVGDLFRCREGNWPCSGQHQSVMQSILDADGWPLILPVCEGLPLQVLGDEAHELLSGLDGLLVAGEGDVEPSQVQVPWEIALIHAAVRQLRLPVLGIGRGMQMLNLALTPAESGSRNHRPIIRIEQFLSYLSFRPSFHHAGHGDGIYASAHGFHPVHILPGSRLASYLGTTYLRVSSLHSCTIGHLAAGLQVCAYSPEGVLEGVVLQDGEDRSAFCLGVQFFPPSRLFTAFVQESKRSLAQRSRPEDHSHSSHEKSAATASPRGK